MPIHMTFDQPPAGIVLTSALPGEDMLISTKAYLSSEDGNDFVSHLEGIWGYFEPSLREQGVMPSQIDHFLALVSPNLETRLFCNELQQRAQVRVKRAIEAGKAVFKDDIATIEELVLHDAGAYAASMASNYNTRPLAPELLLDGGAVKPIRRRQTLDQLLANELLPASLT